MMDEYDPHRAIQNKSEAVARAYQSLSQDARAQVDWVAEELDAQMSQRNSRAKFSHAMAVELLGKIGMLAVHSDEIRKALTGRKAKTWQKNALI
jgi:hypothetical protein